MRGVASVVQQDVGLPVGRVHALIDAPPEVLLALAAPREYREAGLGQCCGHLVLRRVDVTRGPSNLCIGRNDIIILE